MLAILAHKVGHLIKLDRFTLQNDDKVQFAHVCLNINITRPVLRSVTITSNEEDT